MQSPIQKLIAEQLNLQIFQVSNTIQLLDKKQLFLLFQDIGKKKRALWMRWKLAISKIYI